MKNLHSKFNKSVALFASIVLCFVATFAAVAVTGMDVETIYNAAITGGSALGFATLASVIPWFVIEGETKTFKKLDLDQLKDLDTEQVADYYNELNSEKNSKLMELVAKNATEAKDDVAKAIDTLKAELVADRLLQAKALNETLKQIGLKVQKLNDKDKEGNATKSNSIVEGLKANQENLDLLRSDEKSKAVNAGFNFKVVGDMSITGNISGGNVPVEQRIPGFDTIKERRIRLLDIVSTGTASSNLISWVSEANQEGAAGGTTEGTTKNQIDWDLVVDNEAVKKRTAFVKATTEMLGDIEQMATLIRNKLSIRLLKDVENQVYQGDGTGNNLNGILTTATAFSAGTHALAVDNANNVDVLVVAMEQIELAEHEQASFILMNPVNVTDLKLQKVGTADDRYIDRLQQIAGQMLLDGVPIIKTTLVTADTYLVGNFELATVYSKGEISIDVGLDGNDFTKNFRTIIAEWRGANVVETNDRTAFVTGTFSTDKAALETA